MKFDGDIAAAVVTEVVGARTQENDLMKQTRLKVEFDCSEMIEALDKIRRCAIRSHQEIERLNRALGDLERLEREREERKGNEAASAARDDALDREIRRSWLTKKETKSAV